ncbi:MAG TPA: hypothetical protein VFV19_10300 [Candidatus Polarisedimenticolaceae bacterium]|nr:hypothetical protein [Candidatus Polarisedimenticolaceae bacterium]
MKPRDVVPIVFAIAAIAAFIVFLYSAHAPGVGDLAQAQANSMRAGIAIASAVSLWLGCITAAFTASKPVRKRLLIWSGLVAPLVGAATYVVLLMLSA